MRIRHIVSALAAMLRLFSYAFLVPVVVAFLYEPRDLVLAGIALPTNALGFLGGFALINLLAIPIQLATRGAEEEDLSEREGYLTAALGWLLMPFFGMLPFLLDGVFTSPLDAYFETMSGVTTTGFSVLPIAADLVAPSLNFWRALLQWLGGIGIVVLSLALISRLTHGGVRLFAAEAGAHASKRLRPKLADTARTLLGLYAGLSALIATLLFAGMLRIGMAPKVAALDAVIHMMTTLSTAGFSSHAASAGFFQDSLIEAVLILSMLLGATNFQVLLAFRRGDWRLGARDPELRFFLATLGVAIALVVGGLVISGMAPLTALRHGAFATVTLQTTTGLNTVDWSAWPLAVLFILHLTMFVGGSAGSSSGSIKAFRILLLSKLLRRQLQRLIHPRAVISIRMGKNVVPEEAVATAAAFIFTYVLLWVAGSMAISVTEPNLEALEVVAASAGSLGNIGNGFGLFGPSGSVASTTAATKTVMVALMWFGRLEIFTALLLFAPSSWRN